MRIVLTLFLLITTGFGSPVRRPTLDEVVTKSQIIVIGDVAEGLELGPTRVSVKGFEYEAARMGSRILIRAVLKGTIAAPEIQVEWLIPHTPSGGIGYHALVPGTRIVFLNEADGKYRIADPGLPSVPSPVLPLSKGEPLTAVLENVAAVATDVDSDVQLRREAATILQLLSYPIVESSFRKLLQADDPELRLLAIVGLIQRNDWTVLKAISPMLLNGPPPNYPWYASLNLASAISSGSTATQAIPSLGNIVENSREVKFRRAAAFALRRTRDAAALKYLSVALRDTDQEVRYEAIIGLADITGQTAWRPLEEDYKQNEKKYLDFWMAWSAENEPRTVPVR